jgi:hypothetical protein
MAILAKSSIRDGLLLARQDNVFVERLWRTIKFEEVYLRAYDSVSDARQSIEPAFCNCYGWRAATCATAAIAVARLLGRCVPNHESPNSEFRC